MKSKQLRSVVQRCNNKVAQHLDYRNNFKNGISLKTNLNLNFQIIVIFEKKSSELHEVLHV